MPLNLSASMTSWKPSVSSRSASVVGSAVFFAAASAMGDLPDVIPIVLVKIVGVAGHVLGKPQGVVANESLSPPGIARLDRLDDVHMVADRTVGAVAFADGLAPDHPHVGEQVLGKINQHAVAAHADDGLVEFDVDLGIFVEFGV